MNDKLNSLIAELEKQSDLSSDSITSILESLNIDKSSLADFEDKEHSVDHCYGRKEVYSNEKLKILVMTWLPDDYSTIHDHGNIELSVLQVFGEMVHNEFSYSNNKLEMDSCNLSSIGEIIALDSAAIHQMGNETNEVILSLHIYIGDIENDSSRNFDLFSSQVLYTDYGAFYCVPDEFISKRDYGLSASADLIVEETFRRNYRQDLIKSQVN